MMTIKMMVVTFDIYCVDCINKFAGWLIKLLVLRPQTTRTVRFMFHHGWTDLHCGGGLHLTDTRLSSLSDNAMFPGPTSGHWSACSKYEGRMIGMLILTEM